MLSKNDENNKAVFVTLGLMLLSLSLASSIGISTPHYASAQGVTGQGYGNATNATTTGASGGNTTTGVSIVPGASTLTADAYSPNSIQVSAGTTVTWTNDDAQPHTVTSGENATPDGRFDSSIMAPAATFEHTFAEAGEVPYFCILHPNMVGTVSVS
ncbi:MAG: plastocyanin/azurin family copper-binding protein [Thermoproteota archaeon]|nr:plastocyanin/azurin family copper-binding protein [Thermoproteota archaeon]